MSYILPLREYDPQLKREYRYGVVALNMSDPVLSHLMRNLMRFHGVIVEGVTSDNVDWGKTVGRNSATFTLRLPEMVYQRFQDESGILLVEITSQCFVGDRHYQCRIRTNDSKLSTLAKALVQFRGALTCTHTNSYQYEVDCMIKLPKLTWHKFWRSSGIKLRAPTKISVPALYRPIPGAEAYPKLFASIDRDALRKKPVRIYRENCGGLVLRYRQGSEWKHLDHFSNDPELYKAVMDGELLDWVIEAEREIRG